MKTTDDERRKDHIGRGWIGVDLDGTLAHYDTWRGPGHIGEPIAPMVERVKGWLSEGHEVKIFTARVSTKDQDELTTVSGAILQWCYRHIGRTLDITCVKDYQMIELWDDRAIQVIPNTGISIADELAAERSARAGAP